MGLSSYASANYWSSRPRNVQVDKQRLTNVYKNVVQRNAGATPLALILPPTATVSKVANRQTAMVMER